MQYYHLLRALLEEKAPVGLFSLIESAIHAKKAYTIQALNVILVNFMSAPHILPTTPDEWEHALREWVIRDISNEYTRRITSDE